MDKTYVKIFAALLAFGGIAAMLWGGWWLSVTPEYFSIPYSYDAFGRMLYMDTYNPAYTMGYYIILVSIGQLLLALWVHSLSKEKLDVEWLDLVLDKDNPLRCHLIKSDTEEIVNSGTRYKGEDGKPHIKWDKPRMRGDWSKVRVLIADDLKKYMSK